MQQQLKFKAISTANWKILTKYNKVETEQINDYIGSYHNGRWIRFQDDLQFTSNQEYLKRYYKFAEFHPKIRLLGDYYQYHFEAPRIFMAGLARILELNVEEKRELQFAIVTRHMQNKDANSVDDQFLINTLRPTNSHEKLIKDVELSYEDFELRPKKKEPVSHPEFRPNQKLNIEGLTEENGARVMSRVNSIRLKGSFLLLKPSLENNKPSQKQKVNTHQHYKKPNNQRKSKNNQTHKMKNQAILKSKQNSKISSTNNSMASHQGLSRSKSRAQLKIVQTKNQACIECQDKVKYGSVNPSPQNLTKSLSKKQALGEMRGLNSITRKGSKIDLKLLTKASTRRQGDPKQEENRENEKHCQQNEQLILKGRQNKMPVEGKKMFNKALQIKRKK